MNILRITFQEGIPKVQQIVEHLAAAIADGALQPGAKLPAIREMTQALGVSKFTVIEALDRLRGRSLLTSRQGAGYFVARRCIGPNLPSPGNLQPHDVISVLRRSLITAQGALRPGCGFLPESWLASDAMRQAMRSTVRSSLLRVAEYGVPGGYLPLKQALREKLASMGLSIPAEQIVTTSNTMQAIDMLMRLLIRPGDVVLLDDPCYFNFHANLALHGARVVTIPRGPEGLDFNLLEKVLTDHKPRIYLTASVLQNPTGLSFTPSQSFRLLQLAQQHQLHIIEDDLYSDIHSTPPPRLAALAGLEAITYVSGFSKMLSANARVSFIAASPQLAADLTNLKLMSGGLTSELLEQIVYRMLSEGHYGKHLQRVNLRLMESGLRVADWLKEAGCTLPYACEGGMFYWAQLPDGLDSEALSVAALQLDLVLAPGTLFSQRPEASRFVRFNIAHSDDRRVREKFMSLLA
ncbi:PLP-dependent aminotransferase family protein [Paludibacterium yongneupense]|uniref:aminotransferase-like domain-containing protein n=1 Tax=Paludibacterium yongneupense TaxID=400061 RepID=UPI00048D8362|nr:PLP-dependent aminotransferase family protein [Paludibacterium yongneupense]